MRKSLAVALFVHRTPLERLEAGVIPCFRCGGWLSPFWCLRPKTELIRGVKLPSNQRQVSFSFFFLFHSGKTCFSCLWPLLLIRTDQWDLVSTRLDSSWGRSCCSLDWVALAPWVVPMHCGRLQPITPGVTQQASSATTASGTITLSGCKCRPLQSGPGPAGHWSWKLAQETSRIYSFSKPPSGHQLHWSPDLSLRFNLHLLNLDLRVAWIRQTLLTRAWENNNWVYVLNRLRGSQGSQGSQWGIRPSFSEDNSKLRIKIKRSLLYLYLRNDYFYCQVINTFTACVIIIACHIHLKQEQKK